MIHNCRPVTGHVALRRSPKGLLTACWFVALAAACLVLFSNTSFAQGPDPDRFIVQFKERGNSAAARHAISAAGGSVLLEVPAVNAVAARIPAQALQGLRNNPNIALIEQDSPRFPMAQTVPYGIPMVQADQITEGQPGSIKVCVIDSGFDAGHEDLIGANVDGTHVPRSGGGLNLWNTDSCGHGTHVAGTIMAQDNTVGVVGVTPQVSLHIVKVFDGETCGWTYASNTLNAAYACRDAGADVINMSLGCVDSGRGGPWACANSTENNGFQSLYDQGILSVASAGNAGTTQRSYPASYASVVSVAAVDSAEQVASFSQQNSDVELAAPGVAVRSTVPMGKGSEESLTVSGVRYEAIAMEGSPNLTSSGALANCGKALTACTVPSGSKVCLIERGDISFADKVLNCQAGGGTAAVIFNNAPGLFSGTVSGAGTSIPSVGISQEHGQWLLANSIGAASTVVVGLGNYAYYDGTSMAAPHVAGVAALVWSHNPGWSVGEIRAALQVTAKDLGASGKDNAYGYGLVKASDALVYLTGGTPPPPPPPPAENEPPTASFTYSCSGLSCSFDGSGSTDSDGTITSYAWNFGDGSTANGVSANRTYASDGTYSVTLTVTDNAGATGTQIQNVSVTAPVGNGITLTVSGFKVRGIQHNDLSWSGTSATQVDVFRDNSRIATVSNNGSYTDNTGARGGGTSAYRVCEAGTPTCSNIATITY